MSFANPLSIFTTDAADKAAADQKAAIQQGKLEATGALGSGRDALTTNYTAALQPFQTNYDVANKGQQAYADITGVNGPEAAAAARTNFQYSPAYQGVLDQGSQNVLRNQSATGALASGATLGALQQLGQTQASGEWDKYINRLQPFLGQANSSAAGIAGVDTGLGTALNNSYGTQANLDYTSNTDQGKAQANADLAANQASANLWGLGTKLAGAATGGGFMGGLTSFLGGGGNSNTAANNFASNPSNLFPNYGTA